MASRTMLTDDTQVVSSGVAISFTLSCLHFAFGSTPPPCTLRDPLSFSSLQVFLVFAQWFDSRVDTAGVVEPRKVRSSRSYSLLHHVESLLGGAGREEDLVTVGATVGRVHSEGRGAKQMHMHMEQRNPHRPYSGSLDQQE